MVKTSIERIIVIFGLVGAAATCGLAQSPGAKTATEGPRAQIAGTWRGHSVCMVENSPCHNENNVYRFAEIAGKPGRVSVTASKVVEGKEIVMGTSEWMYDQGKQVLEWEGPQGTFRLTVQGDKLEGSLNNRNGVVYRRIYLEKEK